LASASDARCNETVLEIIGSSSFNLKSFVLMSLQRVSTQAWFKFFFFDKQA